MSHSASLFLSSRWLHACAVLSLCGALTLTVAATAAERFTALAANMSNVGTGATGTVDILVNRYSTEAERTRFINVLLEKGADALLEAFRSAPSIGRISTPDDIGYDLRYAHAWKGEDGGRRIVIATDRRIGIWEARNQPRTINYPFTVIELRLDDDGEGEGKLALLTKIYGDKQERTIVLENYASEPVRLLSVRQTS